MSYTWFLSLYMYPAQLRSLPRQADFSPSRQALLSAVTKFTGQALSRSPPSITLPELQTIMDCKSLLVKNCSRRALALPELRLGGWDRAWSSWKTVAFVTNNATKSRRDYKTNLTSSG
ncbi:hypothetical protein ARMSODRAFT_1085923 [Armillaria solidipes]|uniref:Uncharacterized protein n=1 Tax=Armillaria solidipes TaxID=1076256 RepID=A0A2H3BMW7_9AGAR|nr:hypothetical protein ARMSODRAFT_1085923 [Armillaria solidipes]